MANSHRGELEIDLAGPNAKKPEKVLLRMTFNAITEIEEHSGITGVEILDQLSNGKIAVKTVAVIIWAGMRAAMSPNERLRAPTLDTIGDKIFNAGVTNFIVKASEFLAYAFTSKEQQEEISKRLGKDVKPEEKSTT